jgi:hypothetical protein
MRMMVRRSRTISPTPCPFKYITIRQDPASFCSQGFGFLNYEIRGVACLNLFRNYLEAEGGSGINTEVLALYAS